jgi:hypothetical protein
LAGNVANKMSNRMYGTSPIMIARRTPLRSTKRPTTGPMKVRKTITSGDKRTSLVPHPVAFIVGRMNTLAVVRKRRGPVP